ncbi:MAG: hypothetical protein JWR59_512 [Brevundimonas sp.]|nr:hypothetical protein [Brevundimonas sp.]
MNAAKNQGPLSLRRKGRNRLGEPPQGVPVDGDLLGRGPVLCGEIVLKAFQRLKSHDLGTAQMPHDQGPRHLEEVGLGMVDVVEPLTRRQQAVGLLDHVIDVQTRQPSRRQPRPQ